MRYIPLFIVLVTACATPRIQVGLHVGDMVCAVPCPNTCDLIVKEITQDGSVWTEPACMGPRGLYEPADLFPSTMSLPSR